MITKSFDLALVRTLLDRKDLFSPSAEFPILVDLGTGSGKMLIYGAKHGWKCFGVEGDKECVERAQKDIKDAEDANFIEAGLALVAEGDFFPTNLRVSRVPDNRSEDPFFGFLNAGYDHSKNSSPDAPLGVWESMGLDIAEADLWYHFQVERHENLLRFFKLHAKSGAYLVINQTMTLDTFDCPDNVEKLASFGPHYLPGLPRAFELFRKL